MLIIYIDNGRQQPPHLRLPVTPLVSSNLLEMRKKLLSSFGNLNTGYFISCVLDTNYAIPFATIMWNVGDICIRFLRK